MHVICVCVWVGVGVGGYVQEPLKSRAPTYPVQNQLEKQKHWETFVVILSLHTTQTLRSRVRWQLVLKEKITILLTTVAPNWDLQLTFAFYV